MAESDTFNMTKLAAGALGVLLLLSTVLINSLNSEISDNESLIKSQEGEIKTGKDQMVQLGVNHSTEMTALQENYTAAISEIANLTEQNEKLKTPSYQPRFSNHLKASLENWIEDSDSVNSTYGDINTWDTSLITNMSELFYNEGTFNGNISDWDVSSVTDMSSMFNGAESFNGNISDWDVSSVTDMSWMFANAESFNQDISDWDVSSVTDMYLMFDNTFHDPLSDDNKCAIHTSFSSNDNWEYDWDSYCD